MSKEYRKFCAEKGISISYSRKGNPYDNACIESFHAALKKEYVHNEKFENLESLRTGMYKYIEIWYNNSRIHSKIGFISPNEYEESHKEGKKLDKKYKDHSLSGEYKGTRECHIEPDWLLVYEIR